MERTFVENLHKKLGNEVALSGWIHTRRDHGKIIFFDLRDMSGQVQCVSLPNRPEVQEIADAIRPEWVVRVVGEVNSRPEKMHNPDSPTGDLEITVTNITVLSKAEELPFDQDAKLNLDTYLDYLPLTLRHPKNASIFRLQASIVQAFRKALIQKNFIEFQSPTLVREDAEGGASAFQVAYYNGQTAFLATSPQLYKEIVTGAFEKVFTIAKVFRGEKHATSRHLSEITQMDFETSFINDHTDVMSVLESVIREVCESVTKVHRGIFELFETTPPLLPKDLFPVVTLSKAQDILQKEYGIDCDGEPDLDPQHERQLSTWAKEKHQSDFIFVTHFPTAKRAFYSFPDPENPALSRSFDLLFRGLEISSGSQRYHEYDALVEQLRSRHLDPELFSFYLQMHKYGIPPHGGCSTGLERFTARMLELSNIREATLFPRDMNRIDTQLKS